MNDGGFVIGEPVSVELQPDECLLKWINGVVCCVRNHTQHDPTFWRTGVARVPVVR